MKRMNRLSARLLAVAMAACSGTATLASDPVQPVSGTEVVPTSIADYSDGASQPSSSLLSAPQYIQQKRGVHHGPRMYFQTEATFLSRRYDRPETGFELFNSDSATTFNADDVNTVAYDDDGNFENIEWFVGATSVTSSLEPSRELADQLTASPRLALGIVGTGGWGVQGRYWRMENSVGGFGEFIDFDTYSGDVSNQELTDWFNGDLSQTSDFERFNVQTIDLEGSKDFSFYAWRGLATFGARYADLNNVRYSTVDGAIRTGAPGYEGGIGQDSMNDTYHTADYDFSALQTMQFHGVGPTFSLTGFRSLTDNFGLFTSARGSVLFGDSRNSARVEGQMSSLFDDEEETEIGVITSTKELFIAELQLGGQWSCPVRFMNGHFFTRAAFEYQFWRNSTDRAFAAIDEDDLDDFRSTHTIINGDIESGIGTTQGRGYAFGLEPDFDLIGFSLSTGFVW